MERCASSAADVDAFLALLRYTGEHYVPAADASVSLDQFVADTAIDRAVAKRAFKYAEIDGGRFTKGRSEGNLTPDRFSRRLRNVRSLDDLNEQLRIEADAMSIPGVPATRGVESSIDADATELAQNASSPNIFLSHSGHDAPLAEFLESTIRAQAPAARVFRTSRPDQLPSGESWFRSIEDNLRSASAYLVLITSNSETRPWILFETGAAWFSKKPLVPVVAGISKESLDEPLRLLQLLDLEVEAEADVAFRRLAIPPPELKSFANAARTIASALKSSARAKPEWDEVMFEGNRYVWGGPVHTLPLGTDGVSPDGLLDALRKSGLMLVSGAKDDPDGARARKGFSPLFLVDKWSARHWLYTKDGQLLYAKPSPTPRT